MIKAYDQSIWHPDANLIVVWLLALLLSTVALFFLARGVRTPALYVGVALPLILLLGFNAYVDYGHSGMELGDGNIGIGAHLTPLHTLTATAVQSVIIFPPILAGVLLVHWQTIRVRLPALYWTVLAIAMLAHLYAFLVGVILLDQ